MDERAPPSSLGPIAASVPVPGAKPKVPVRQRLLFVPAVAALIGAVAFGVWGILRTSSLDVPWGNVRVGFYENGWPQRWVCAQGHDHWSAPYWSGAVMLLALSALLGRAWRTRMRVRR